jgi:elongator complex protein 3
MTTSYDFSPARYEGELSAIFVELAAEPNIDQSALQRVLRRHPKDGRGFFSKSDLLRGYRHLRGRGRRFEDEKRLLAGLRMKPVRTRSGVAPVTVLTQPFPCPGRCVFCPSDVRMPKSYVSSEPGAQRAAEHRFDPYRQVSSRLHSLHSIGHPVDKVELIVLGGTWTSYPELYRIWFVTRCFEALNAFDASCHEAPKPVDGYAFEEVAEQVDGRRGEQRYNDVIRGLLTREQTARPRSASSPGDAEKAWLRLGRAHRDNERATCRSVGLVLETRPDEISPTQVRSLRRLGATKVQIGVQSLDDEVLRLNRRGHDVAATRRAVALLRGAGFKIHAHWMPNLLGSTPARDIADFRRLFADPDFRPDELKIYPCSLLETAELMRYYERGEWRPYTLEELEEVLGECFAETPAWCRLTRVIRDIPSTEIVVGNRLTNLRERVERRLAEQSRGSVDIRAREVRELTVDAGALGLEVLEYESSSGRELFLQLVTASARLAAFLRLTLPTARGCMGELDGSALLREVHVYGDLVELGETGGAAAQHRGLGRRLIDEAARHARAAGFADLAVISAVGTRGYYRRLGFGDGELYQHLAMESGS